MAKRSRPRTDLITTYGDTSPFAEAYRMLRINLLAADGKALWSVGITGVNPQSGSSTTAANLGLIMAETGKRVVLVDADLYKPVLHRMFGISNEVGLSSVLQGEVSAERALQVVTEPELLRVLAAGPMVRNPAALLRPDLIAAFLEALREHTDYLILDLPSVGAVAYASFLATFMDGVVLVVRAGAPSTGVERIMKRRLQGVKVVGMVLNGVPVSGSEVPAYRYYAQLKS